MAKDLFSTHANEYANFRPAYPVELIDYIVSFVENKDIAWDCATGNGQAAILLANHFKKVIATGLSEQQIKAASPHPSIEYAVSPAESTPFPDQTFDLIRVAQAYHWFNHRKFLDEAIRVAKPGAIAAIWGYNLVHSHNTAINSLIEGFYYEETNPYWEPERTHLEKNYRETDFLIHELVVDQEFKIRTSWTIEQLKGYLNTWSAVKKFIQQNSFNPVHQLINKITPYWGNVARIEFEFPIALRMGEICPPV